MQTKIRIPQSEEKTKKEWFPCAEESPRKILKFVSAVKVVEFKSSLKSLWLRSPILVQVMHSACFVGEGQFFSMFFSTQQNDTLWQDWGIQISLSVNCARTVFDYLLFYHLHFYDTLMTFLLKTRYFLTNVKWGKQKNSVHPKLTLWAFAGFLATNNNFFRCSNGIIRLLW